MSKKASKILALDEKNAEVLVELVCGPDISENLRISAMEKLVASKDNDNFFQTLFEEKLSYGSCPHCRHENHWMLPEDEANQMGWVSHDEDERVPEHTNAKSCPTFEQACKKKRCTT